MRSPPRWAYSPPSSSAFSDAIYPRKALKPFNQEFVSCFLPSGLGATADCLYHGLHQPPFLWGTARFRPSPSEPLLIVLESYHSILKLSTKKCLCQGKMFPLGERSFCIEDSLAVVLLGPLPEGAGLRSRPGECPIPGGTPPPPLTRSPSPYGGGKGNHSLLRMILPEMVLGSSSRNSTILGYL